MSGISLTASMRSNLLSLQNIASQQDIVQNRLATGLKVSSAIDNPSSYYTASSLNNRAADLTALLDSMSQGIQTIKAASEAIDSGTKFLEQAKAVANQTLTEAPMIPHQVEIEYDTNVAALIAQGYTAVDSTMTAAELQALLNTDNAKVVLTEDITFSGNLDFKGNNIVINGGGHKITMNSGNILNRGTDATFENMQIESNYGKNGWYTRGIHSEGANTTVHNVEIILNDVKSAGYGLELHGGGTVEKLNIKLNGNAEQLVGVYAWGSASVSNVNVALSGGDKTLMAAIASQSKNVTIDKIGMTENGGKAFGILGSVKNFAGHAVGGSVDRNSSLFNGQANTDAILATLGEAGLAASAADKFYIGDKNGTFGQGNWYLPSIVELMNVYGYDADKITGGILSNSGATGSNKAAINATLEKLKANGAEAEKLTDGYYWSSSENSTGYAWHLTMSSSYRSNHHKGTNSSIRCFQQVENCFNPDDKRPQIGDVMYDDKSFGSADDYAAAKAAGKTAVGVITEVLDNSSIKIMNLKDLTFSSSTSVGNFDPDNPYGGSVSTTRWSTGNDMYKDIARIENFADWELVLAMNPKMTVVDVNTLNAAFAQVDIDSFQVQYNQILSQYDGLVADASYKGINLLNGQRLKINFNEDRSSGIEILGVSALSADLGIVTAAWQSKADIEKSVSELEEAINTLRGYASQYGNYYSIVTTRQDFTENLINILEEGADKLTLADMNQESANMLALQTSRQLAVNSLSLASQASQAVLRLF